MTMMLLKDRHLIFIADFKYIGLRMKSNIEQAREWRRISKHPPGQVSKSPSKRIINQNNLKWSRGFDWTIFDVVYVESFLSSF